MQVRSLIAATLAVVAFGAADVSQAAAITFDSVGDTGTFHYGALVDGASLCADVTYTLASWGGASATFNVAATNCSSGAGSGSNPNRMVSIGLGVIAPDLNSADVAGVSEWDAKANTNFPGFGNLDLCIYTGSNCAGGSNNGVYMGTTDSFNLTLGFVSNVDLANPITFTSPFVSRWQSVGISGNGANVAGCMAGDSRCSNQVPEPATLSLLGLGLLGVAVRRRKL